MASEVTEALEAWREALREADEAPRESLERASLEQRVEQTRLAYRAAVLRLTGRKDQLDGAAESSTARLRASRSTIDDFRRQGRDGSISD
jgi:hypothetical protein